MKSFLKELSELSQKHNIILFDLNDPINIGYLEDFELSKKGFHYSSSNRVLLLNGHSLG